MCTRATLSLTLNTEKKIKLNRAILEEKRKSAIKRSSNVKVLYNFLDFNYFYSFCIIISTISPAYINKLLIPDRFLSYIFFINSFYSLRTRIIKVITVVLQLLIYKAITTLFR